MKGSVVKSSATQHGPEGSWPIFHHSTIPSLRVSVTNQPAVSSALKPVASWLPSQKGLFLDWPQRQR